MWEGALGDAFAVLQMQKEAWNAGDVHRFMEGYERSAETTFVSGGGALRRGHAALLADYAARYATREAMGTLDFRDVEMRLLADDVALAIGRFALQPATEGAAPATGRFSLVLRRGADGWRVVHDHTS
jgi:uncharacterized protein (TIGR02246 family)